MVIFAAILIFVLGVILATFLLSLGRTIMFMIPILHGPVFIPSADDKLQTMLKLAKPKKSDRIIDLGSGDGKVIIALAQQGLDAEGIEINPLLVRKTQQQIKKLGLSKKAKVKRGNFWKFNYAKYDLVFLYGTSYIMKKLETKLLRELKPGAKIISNYFQFPNWQPIKNKNQIRVYQKK